MVLTVDTDFADLFEVKDGAVAAREIVCSHDDGTLTLAYACASFERSVTIAASRTAEVTPGGFAYPLALAPGEQWATTFTVTPHAAQPGVTFARREPRGTLAQLSASKSAELQGWLAQGAGAAAQDTALMHTYRASLSDLGALRMHPDLAEGATLPAAGLPWFMALFGRDSLITSFQTLPYLPGLAATTLRVLAARQASCVTTSTSRSRARSSTSCASASSPRAASDHTRRTSGPPTPRRCSSSCSTSTTAGRATTSSSARSSRTLGPRWPGSRTAGTSTATATSSTPPQPGTGLVNQCWKDSWNRSSSPTARWPRADRDV